MAAVNRTNIVPTTDANAFPEGKTTSPIKQNRAGLLNSLFTTPSPVTVVTFDTNWNQGINPGG